VEHSYNAVPRELRDRAQWVTFRLIPKPADPNKYDKVPHNPRTGATASVDDAATWGTFDEALAGIPRWKHDGIGFVFTKNDDFAGLDLDKCRDTDTGEIAPWANSFIVSMGSYAEQSVSGTGVHVLARGSVPSAGHRRRYESGEVEMYDSGRFFAFTGIPIQGTPDTLADCTEMLQRIHDLVWADDPYGTDTSKHALANTDGYYARVRYGATNLSDIEVLERCRNDATGDLFVAIYDQANLTDVTGDDSRADWFVWNKLTFYIGNEPDRIKRLAERGEHYLHSDDPTKAKERKAKWNEPRNPYATLQDQTISKILASRTASQIYGGAGALNTAEELNVLVEKSLATLGRVNNPALDEPTLYMWGGSISWIQTDKDARPIVASLTEAALKVELDAMVRYVKRTDKGSVARTRPPLDVVQGVMSAKHIPLPVLVGITEVPVLRPDGTIVNSPGYDAATRLLYRPAHSSSVVPHVSDTPTDAEIQASFSLLHEVITDFPFHSPADKANALALMLTLVMRAAINSNTPMGLLDAPSPGTGKGLLAEVIAVIATGQAAATITEAENEAEWRKLITSTLLTGQAFHIIDNVENTLRSAKLAAMLTSPIWEDRALGTNKVVRIGRSERGVWCATGNNITLDGDMARRCYRIRIDARVQNPFLRAPDSFKHWLLLPWVAEQRHNILHALLTVCRAWYARGKPTKGAPTVGSFEDWSRMLWGVLSLDPTRVSPNSDDATCYGAHFLGNGAELWEQGDTDAKSGNRS
jgi:hypothetical protein